MFSVFGGIIFVIIDVGPKDTKLKWGWEEPALWTDANEHCMQSLGALQYCFMVVDFQQRNGDGKKSMLCCFASPARLCVFVALHSHHCRCSRLSAQTTYWNLKINSGPLSVSSVYEVSNLVTQCLTNIVAIAVPVIRAIEIAFLSLQHRTDMTTKKLLSKLFLNSGSSTSISTYFN